jgi:hypothetical protein
MARPVVTLALLASALGACEAFGDAGADGDRDAAADDAGAGIEDGEAPGDGRAPTGRVEEGLVALYTFGERQGAVVRDVSGVGEPLDLHIRDENAISWSADGLTLRTPGTAVSSDGPATKIVSRCSQANEITFEAWVRPALAEQKGPARIVVLGTDATTSSIMLGLGNNGSVAATASRYLLRVANVAAETEEGTSRAAELQHVVGTASGTGPAYVYVDGVVRGTVASSKLASSSWADVPLALGDNPVPANDGNPRHFVGTYALVAVYCRALSPADVLVNFAAKPRP